MEASRAAIRHVPVMVSEVCAAITPTDGETYVDGTFGAGGYSQAFLEAAQCRVFGIDRDPAAIARGRDMEIRYGGRLTLIEGRFSEMDDLLAAEGVSSVEGVALDIGVSSMQLDDAARGFSFMHDGPLDMRMGASGPTAADVVNGESEGDLADIIYRFGEERHARRIARAIVERRADSPIVGTAHLATVVSGAIPGAGRSRIHPATRTFQALRVYVNEELGPDGELERGLVAAERLLAPDGRLAVVTFHSLEDRAVKAFFRDRSGQRVAANRHLPEGADIPPAMFARPKMVKPSPDEIARNPRARSAKLRCAVRTAERAVA